MVIPPYVGRYPKTCPECGHELGHNQTEYDSEAIKRAVQLLGEMDADEALLREVYQAYAVKKEPELERQQSCRSPDAQLTAEGVFFDNSRGHYVAISREVEDGRLCERAFGPRPDLKAWLNLVPHVDMAQAMSILEAFARIDLEETLYAASVCTEARGWFGESHLLFRVEDGEGVLTVHPPNMYRVVLERRIIPPTQWKQVAKKMYKAHPEAWARFEGQIDSPDNVTVDPDDFYVTLTITHAGKTAPDSLETFESGELEAKLAINGLTSVTIPLSIANAWLQSNNLPEVRESDPTVEATVTVEEAYTLLAQAAIDPNDIATGDTNIDGAEGLSAFLRRQGEVEESFARSTLRFGYWAKTQGGVVAERELVEIIDEQEEHYVIKGKEGITVVAKEDVMSAGIAQYDKPLGSMNKPPFPPGQATDDEGDDEDDLETKINFLTQMKEGGVSLAAAADAFQNSYPEMEQEDISAMVEDVFNESTKRESFKTEIDPVETPFGQRFLQDTEFIWVQGHEQGMTFKPGGTWGVEGGGNDQYVRGHYTNVPGMGDIGSDIHQITDLMDQLERGNVQVMQNGQDVTDQAKKFARKSLAFMFDDDEDEDY
jgi:hypothetical protein